MRLQRGARRASTTSRSAVIHVLRCGAASMTGRRHPHRFGREVRRPRTFCRQEYVGPVARRPSSIHHQTRYARRSTARHATRRRTFSRCAATSSTHRQMPGRSTFDRQSVVERCHKRRSSASQQFVARLSIPFGEEDIGSVTYIIQWIASARLSRRVEFELTHRGSCARSSETVRSSKILQVLRNNTTNNLISITV